ncbi:hypothetical protein COCVIDRAFT_96232, partial [Bipolaris victoriae FI3]
LAHHHLPTHPHSPDSTQATRKDALHYYHHIKLSPRSFGNRGITSVTLSKAWPQEHEALLALFVYP